MLILRWGTVMSIANVGFSLAFLVSLLFPCTLQPISFRSLSIQDRYDHYLGPYVHIPCPHRAPRLLTCYPRHHRPQSVVQSALATRLVLHLRKVQLEGEQRTPLASYGSSGTSQKQRNTPRPQPMELEDRKSPNHVCLLLFSSCCSVLLMDV